jgi:hypothetical protein
MVVLRARQGISLDQPMDILRAIGNTSIVRLQKVVPPGCAEILVKLEWENPTGSMKDRMAQAVISRADEDGRLKSGYTVMWGRPTITMNQLLQCVTIFTGKGYPAHHLLRHRPVA